MPKIACIGHRTEGHCSAHRPGGHGTGGKIISGPMYTTICGKSMTTVSYQVQADCGSIGTLVTGSGISDIDGKPVCRVGDRFEGTYTGTIVEGWDFCEDNG